MMSLGMTPFYGMFPDWFYFVIFLKWMTFFKNSDRFFFVHMYIQNNAFPNGSIM